jgi:hypothetical protein
MKSIQSNARDRKLSLNKETLRQLKPAELREVEGGVALTQNVGSVCELVSLALSCEIIQCF